MALVVNEGIIMTEKARDSVDVSSLLWKVLLPFINAAYTRILRAHIL
jgi:hypothetical protein